MVTFIAASALVGFFAGTRFTVGFAIFASAVLTAVGAGMAATSGWSIAGSLLTIGTAIAALQCAYVLGAIAKTLDVERAQEAARLSWSVERSDSGSRARAVTPPRS